MTLVDSAPVRMIFERLGGRRLSIVKNAGNILLFGFGEHLEVDTEHTSPEFGLHVQCPWRIENTEQGRIVTGSSDFYVPAPDNHDETWKPTNGSGSLQKYRMLELLHGANSPIRSNRNTSGQLRVASAELLPYFGLSINLSPSYLLSVFPDGTADEGWRLIDSGPPSTHYVLKDSRLQVE